MKANTIAYDVGSARTQPLFFHISFLDLFFFLLTIFFLERFLHGGFIRFARLFFLHCFFSFSLFRIHSLTLNSSEKCTTAPIT